MSTLRSFLLILLSLTLAACTTPAPIPTLTPRPTATPLPTVEPTVEVKSTVTATARPVATSKLTATATETPSVVPTPPDYFNMGYDFYPLRPDQRLEHYKVPQSRVGSIDVDGWAMTLMTLLDFEPTPGGARSWETRGPRWAVFGFANTDGQKFAFKANAASCWGHADTPLAQFPDRLRKGDKYVVYLITTAVIPDPAAVTAELGATPGCKLWANLKQTTDSQALEEWLRGEDPSKAGLLYDFTLSGQGSLIINQISEIR